MTRPAAIALALLGVLGAAAPPRAQDRDFCTTLKAAWMVAKADPQALGDQRIAGASVCARLDRTLQCSWLAGTKEGGRDLFDRFKTEAAACLGPLGLLASAQTVAGSETSLLEGADQEPAVAIIYPGNATVSVTIIPPD